MISSRIVGQSLIVTQSHEGSLNIGDWFPQFSGHTLTGKFVTLPIAFTGKSSVLVFSFSRNAGKDARLWNEHLSNDFPDAIHTYGVVLLESAPRLFRGMALSGMKSIMPLSVQDRTIVLYHDEKLWEQRLEVSDDSRAYVVLLGRNSRVLWRNLGAFTGTEYTQLKSEISHSFTK